MGKAAVILISVAALACLSVLPAAAAEEGTVVFRVQVRGEAPEDAWSSIRGAA